MSDKQILRIYRVTALITIAAIVFYLFFEINKKGLFRDINPFGEDPYDAVGSFAIQIALLIGILTYARALRLRLDPALASRARLILCGNLLVVGAILVTLIADAVAEAVSRLPPSYWGNILLLELTAMFVLALACTTALALAYRHIPVQAPPVDLTPADGIDDLWTLVRAPVSLIDRRLPRGLVAWVRGYNSDWLFARLPWANPRRHPWRFVCLAGLVVGVGLFLAQLQEGLPPSLPIALILAVIFIGAEFAAAIIGYALFGGLLGIRPAFRGIMSHP
jgi:hypothetical protein